MLVRLKKFWKSLFHLLNILNFILIMKTENKYLQIEGIAGKKILSELLGEKISLKQNTEWFFVSYSPVEYYLDTKFDIIIAGEQKSMLPKFFNIKLIDVIEQTGKHLDVIPLGWKTICKFEFKPVIPPAVRELPVLSYWNFISRAKFARHEDITMDSSKLRKDVYAEAISDVISMSMNSQTIDKKNKEAFLETISKIMLDNSREMKNKISNTNLIEKVKRRQLHIS